MDRADSILIVDDDPEIRRLLVDYLARNGYAAHPARDGREMKKQLNEMENMAIWPSTANLRPLNSC